MDENLTWEDSYAIARVLSARHPGINLNEVSLKNIYDWTLALPSFCDQPELANDAILLAIFREWFEEVNPL